MLDETSYETLTETQVVNKLHEMTAPFFETFVSEIAKLFYWKLTKLLLFYYFDTDWIAITNEHKANK